MGSTVANGVILQVPYGLVRNFRDALNEKIDVLIMDANLNPRTWVHTKAALTAGIPFYVNDTIRVNYRAATVGGTPICDIITVNPSTGAESVAQTISFTAPLQRSMVAKCTAINAGSGVATITTGFEVW